MTTSCYPIIDGIHYQQYAPNKRGVGCIKSLMVHGDINIMSTQTNLLVKTDITMKMTMMMIMGEMKEDKNAMAMRIMMTIMGERR